MAVRIPFITLTTDFGTADHFVGAMKGVVADICPVARVVDITHELTSYEILEAAFTFDQAWRCFPPRTVHVAVVDPGVGSARRAIVIEAGGHFFVGPDNGIFSYVLHSEKAKVRVVDNARYLRKPVSHTFHGRDVFAPVAAHLAKGLAPSKLGPIVKDALRLALPKPVQTSKRQWSGSVLKADRFGNLITSFPVAEFPWVKDKLFVFQIGLEEVTKFATHYAECQYGELYAVAGSAGYFEIVLREASAAKRLGLGAGAPVELMGWDLPA